MPRKQYNPQKQKEAQDRWRNKHWGEYIEKSRPQRRNKYLIDRYGITQDDFVVLSRQQGERCAICRELPTNIGKDVLCMDHSHVTGENRALLCVKCNAALGQMRDNPRFLRLAADYLDYYNERGK